MMMRWLRVFLLAGATVTMVSSTASAICAVGSLAGRWDSYATGDVDGEAFWEQCEFRFDSTGRILTGSACRNDSGERSTLSGNFILNSFCRATGTVTQQYPGERPTGCVINRATLSKYQEVLTGVGTCKSSKSIFSFTMIRH
jgi:hypothetical protein